MVLMAAQTGHFFVGTKRIRYAGHLVHAQRMPHGERGVQSDLGNGLELLFCKLVRSLEECQRAADAAVLVALQAKRIALGAELVFVLADVRIVTEYAFALFVWSVLQCPLGFFVAGETEL